MLVEATLPPRAMTVTPTSPPPEKAGPSRELLRNVPFLLKLLGVAAKERSLQAFQSTGLNPQHYAVLSLLAEGTRETQATIADALGYDRSHLVGLLDDLEGKNLVERRRDPGDRRRHVVSMTPAGKKTLGQLRTLAQQVEQDFLAPLDADERQTLHALLLELVAHHDPRCGDAVTSASA
jgi:MarR family transcriptional regulator, lower aerobic nicotinate degradation pathway regulator